MKIQHSKTARGVRTVEQHGAKYQIECTRTTGYNDGSIDEQTRVQDARTKRSRLLSEDCYQSSLTFGRYRGTPVLAFDEVVIKKISGQLAPGKNFRVDLSKVFPPIPNDETQTAAPSVGRVQTPVVLDFAAVMPAPIVNVAPAPAPQVKIVNDIQPPPPPPLLKELWIIRDDDGKITGALIS